MAAAALARGDGHDGDAVLDLEQALVKREQGLRSIGGKTIAVGPRITLAIFSGNVPGLPALSIVRALLVKSAVIATMPLLRLNCRESSRRYHAPMKPPATGIFFRSSLSTAKL